MPRPADYRPLREPVRGFLWKPWVRAFTLEIAWSLLFVLAGIGFDLNVDDFPEAAIGFGYYALALLFSWSVCIPWFAWNRALLRFPWGSWFTIQFIRFLCFPVASHLIPWMTYGVDGGWFEDTFDPFVLGLLWFCAIGVMPVGCLNYAFQWQKAVRQYR